MPKGTKKTSTGLKIGKIEPNYENYDTFLGLSKGPLPNRKSKKRKDTAPSKQATGRESTYGGL